MKSNFKNYLVKDNITIKEALRKLELSSEKCLIISNKKLQVLGTITDGDLRRAILEGAKFSSSIKNYYNKKPLIIKEGEKNFLFNKLSKKYIEENKIASIPVINRKKKLVKIITPRVLKNNEKENKKKLINTHVVIMAGGRGARLKPVSNILPKPLFPISGDKSVLEVIIQNFTKFDIKNFIISLNYKVKLIKAFLKDKNFNAKIKFVEEKTPLGTIGSLSKLKKIIKTDFIVSNCDIILNINVHSLYNFHKSKNYDLTLVASEKNVKIPYGSCLVKSNGTLKKIHEKPEINYLANAGLYVIKHSVINLIPKNKEFNMDELIKKMLKKKKKVGVFPINSEAWMDMGEWPEYNNTLNTFNK